MKKKDRNSLLTIIAILFCSFLISLYNNTQLQEENEFLRKGNNYLSNCYYCGVRVELFTMNDSFYIQCKGCKLRTAYFKSKIDLVNYWNKDY